MLMVCVGYLVEMSDEDLQHLPVGARQLAQREVELVQAAGLAVLLHCLQEVRVELVCEERLVEVPEILLDGTGQGLALPQLGVGHVGQVLAGPGLQGLLQQCLHLGRTVANIRA